MNQSDWKTFLTEYNRELLSYEEVVEKLPREVIKSGWLGYPAASETKVVAAERKLGTQLPPSYRAFLRVSDGWRIPSVSILDLRPVNKIDWFREENQDWIDVYVQGHAELPPISDKKYFVYGDKQDCIHFRAEYLTTALQISDVNDGAVLLLNPKIVTPEGEWEVWFFANWLPGAIRYRSFAEWFTAQRAICRDRLKPLSSAKVKQYVTAKKPVSTKKAQAAARRGETEVAMECLASFAAKGDDSAAASLAELHAFKSQWEEVIPNAGRLIANPGAVYAGNVFNDMIRLLGRAGHGSGKWDQVVEVVHLAIKTNDTREYGEYGEPFRVRNDKVFRNLIKYAKRKGKAPHELIEIFGVSTVMEEMSDQERKAWYQNAVEQVDSNRPDLKKDPRAKAEYFFSLAKDSMEEEAVKLYERYGHSFTMAWDAAEYVAQVYVRREKSEAAWAVIEANLGQWWPVDHAQVLPVTLLIDEHLRTFMTPERCQIVLSTPRGPEAAKA